MFVIVQWEPHPIRGFDPKNIQHRVIGSFDKMSLATDYLEKWKFQLHSIYSHVWYRSGGEGGMFPTFAKIEELHPAVLPDKG